MSVGDLLTAIKTKVSALDVKSYNADDVGFVVSVADGVVYVVGLDSVKSGESVVFETGVRGLVLNIEEDSVGIVVLGSVDGLFEGAEVRREKESLSVPVGKAFLGRVVDALGNPVDGFGEIEADGRSRVERKAPGIMERRSVFEPLSTGIKAIDSMIPIGRGQRELIIGDRQTGKTSIIIDTILNLSKANQSAKKESDKVFCIYVAIGQRRATVARIAKSLKEAGALKDTIIVSSTSSELASLQFLAPYTGCALGEYFRDNGMHAVVIYDDLSKHAAVWRQISLLLRRPPGREAYPADVFYVHSRLLERAAKMSDALGAGSLTALPIIETQSNDIAAYIPSSVISITDGQIFLETDLFNSGIRPAINIGLSVSRVGGAAQTKAIRRVAGKIKLDLAQFRELQTFSQFGSDLDPATIRTLEKGRKISEIMKQKNNAPLSTAEQVVVFFSISEGLIDKIPVSKIKLFEEIILKIANTKYKSLLETIETTGVITPQSEVAIREIIDDSTKIILSEVEDGSSDTSNEK